MTLTTDAHKSRINNAVYNATDALSLTLTDTDLRTRTDAN